MNNALPGQALTAIFINVQSSVVNLVTCQLQLHDFDWKGSICKSVSFLSTFAVFDRSVQLLLLQPHGYSFWDFNCDYGSPRTCSVCEFLMDGL